MNSFYSILLCLLWARDFSKADWFKANDNCSNTDLVAKLGPPDAQVNFLFKCQIFHHFSWIFFQFSIGWLSPQRQADCQSINIEAVEEVLAANWALTMWNQHEQNQRHKLCTHEFQEKHSSNMPFVKLF